MIPPFVAPSRLDTPPLVGNSKLLVHNWRQAEVGAAQSEDSETERRPKNADASFMGTWCVVFCLQSESESGEGLPLVKKSFCFMAVSCGEEGVSCVS